MHKYSRCTSTRGCDPSGIQVFSSYFSRWGWVPSQGSTTGCAGKTGQTPTWVKVSALTVPMPLSSEEATPGLGSPGVALSEQVGSVDDLFDLVQHLSAGRCQRLTHRDGGEQEVMKGMALFVGQGHRQDVRHTGNYRSRFFRRSRLSARFQACASVSRDQMAEQMSSTTPSQNKIFSHSSPWIPCS